MNIIDKIALNRLIKILTNFIITIVKLFNKEIDKPDSIIPDEKKPKFPWIRKKLNRK